MNTLYELSKEYLDLYDLAEDEEYEMDEDELRRYEQLRELNDEIGNGADILSYPNNVPHWIPESEWVSYVEECAYDLGYLQRDSNIAQYVDFKEMASDWESDYETVEFDGEIYYLEIR